VLIRGCLQDVVEKKLSQMILDKKFSGEHWTFIYLMHRSVHTASLISTVVSEVRILNADVTAVAVESKWMIN